MIVILYLNSEHNKKFYSKLINRIVKKIKLNGIVLCREVIDCCCDYFYLEEIQG